MDKRDYQLMHTQSFKDQKKLDDEMAMHKVKCPNCGHTMAITFVERRICSWCKHWVYKDKATEFRYNLLKEMKK